MQSEELCYPSRRGANTVCNGFGLHCSKINTEHVQKTICSCALGPRMCTSPRMDNLTRAQRSATMRRVRSRDTKPELVVRRLVHALGYRYRLYRSNLPGKPDLVFPRRNKAIFVHGCFWHGHDCGAGTNRPSSNLAYWRAKLLRNKRRDVNNRAALKILGWKVLVIWECQLGNLERLRSRIERFLET
jgi:DNA mismatch endonuclease (patch repair protein)